MVGDSPSPGVCALFLVCVLCVCGAPAQASSLLIPFAVISLMDRIPLREFDENTTVCFNNVPVSSSGCWLGDDPLQATLPLLMLQLSLIVVFCRAAHSVLRRLGQVEATCQIIVGFLLGPSVAGRITWFRLTLFPERSWIHLITVGQLGYSLFMFLVGVKTDMSLIMKSGRKPVVVGLASIFVPTVLMLLLTYTLRVPVGLRPIIDAMACLRTPFAVVHHTLAELRLLNSVVGRVAMSASFVSYFVFGIALSLYESMTAGTWMGSQLSGVLTFSSLLAMAVLTVFAIRAVTLWMIKKTPAGRPLPERHIVAVLVMAFGCGMMFEVLGYHFSIGMFFVGLGLPSGPPLGTALVQRLEGMVSTLFVPTFLALGGFMANISAVTDKTHLVYMQLFFAFSFLAKFAGVMSTALYCRIPLRESFSLSLVMNVRGINELQVLNVLQNTGVIRNQAYVVAIFFIVASSGIVTPLLKLVYRPSATYAASHVRTIQHSKDDTELRVLACVHSEEDVGPITDVLQAVRPPVANSQGRPICIYVLHLIQMVDRVAAVLAPHRMSKRRSAHRGADLTDQIVHAFRHIEQVSHTSVIPFVSICPNASMHLDVCALAMEKNVALLILPFHKKMVIHGAVEVTNTSHREVNMSVLNYAPCSVGILVNPRPSKGPASTVVASRYNARLCVAVYFLGGPDDREALCFAGCMSGNPKVHLTLVRFRLPSRAAWADAAEERLDDEVVGEFLQSSTTNNCVVHWEEVVQDGEGIVGLIKQFGEEFNLVIVGRRQGMESSMMAGMAEWSEYPELGVLGDMLASTSLGSRAATLVVQQQSRASRVRQEAQQQGNESALQLAETQHPFGAA